MAIKHSTVHVPNDIVASADWNANHTGTLDHQTQLTNVTPDQHHAQSHNAVSHSDIASTGAQIDDAVSKKHTQNTDTSLGAQSENLDMNTHKVVGVVDPAANQDAATKKYVDDEIAGVAAGATELIAAGTVTLLAATVAYDTNFADIAIGAGDLTVKDSILILIEANPATNQNISFKVDIRDVTAAGSIVGDGPLTAAGDDYVCMTVRIFNDGTTNDIMIGETYWTSKNGAETQTMTRVDTNDANVFTTAFSIRINPKYDAGADADTIIRYSVHKLIGQ